MVLSSDWLKITMTWFKSTYETVSFDGKEVKVSDGYEPRILDFQIIDHLGDDRADEFLNYDGTCCCTCQRFGKSEHVETG